MNRKQRRAEGKQARELPKMSAPTQAATLFGIAAAHHAAGRFVEAETAYRRALALQPDLTDALVNLGDVLTAQGKLDEAVTACRRALEQRPGFAEAHNNLGVALGQQGHTEAEAACYERAIALKPNFAEAHANLGNVLKGWNRPHKAEPCYRRALALKPNFPEAHLNLGAVLMEQSKLDAAAVSFKRALTVKPDYAEAYSNLLVSQHYSARVSNAELFAAARGFGAEFGRSAPRRAFANDRSPSRRLRIGYVSGDFRRHPVGFFLARVLEAHDRVVTETFCYANDDKSDEMTERLRAAARHWRGIAKLSDREAAALILQDEIDILVDLSGHTAKNRLSLFALRPAPVQASWIGYFGTTGLEAIDYVLMDETTVPTGEERWFSENVVRLPHGRFCYAPPCYAPAPVDPPALRRGFVTFGSFNNVGKINGEVARLWSIVLRAVPGARLLLKWKSLDDEDARKSLRAIFAAEGIPDARLEFRGFSPHEDMLAQYGDVDVALDPFPFGGGLTSCEALWMGVPVVTLLGDRPVSRQTAGILGAIGLTNCVARSPDDYVRLAAALAADPNRLATLRRLLRPSMTASPLCEGVAFTAALEASFREMWARWSAGERVAPIDAGAVAAGAR